MKPGRRPQDCRVLVVEDEYVIAFHLCQSLREAGMTVVGPAANVADALALLARTPELDGAVLDVNLGGEPAYPVADALQARGVPFLLATGYDLSVMPERYAGVTYVQKPVDVRTVAQALDCRGPEPGD